MRYLVKSFHLLVLLLVFINGGQKAVSQTVPELIYYTFDAPGNQYNYASAPVGDNPATLVDLGIGGAGQFGTALFGTDIPGSGRFLDTNWIMDLPVTGWTISFWFNSTSNLTDPPEVIFNDKGATVYGCYRPQGKNEILFINWASVWEIKLDNLPTGPFVVHYVYDGNEIKAYINGVYKVTTITGPTNFISAHPLAIGGWTGAENIRGSTQIDEFRIYNRTLSDAEIVLTWNKNLLIPEVTTLAATTVTTNGATLNANVNANGISSLVIFEYGTTTAYGSTTPGVPSPVTGFLDTPVSAILTGLTPNTLYHYRVVATSSFSANGNDLTFDLVPLPGITGPNSICEGTENNVYTTESGKSNYVWVVSAGGTITAGGTTVSNTVTVTWNTAGAQQVSVNYENSNGIPAASPTIYPVTVNSLPVPTIYSPTLLSESFENAGAIPADWSIETIVPNNTVSFVNASISPVGYSANDGNWFVRFDSYSFGNGVVRLKRNTPVSTLNSKKVSIDFAWFHSSSFPSANDVMSVEWSVDGTNWSTAGTFFRYYPVQGWKTKTLDLPQSATEQATLYIAFKFESNFGNDCYLDMAKVFISNTDVCSGKTISYQTEPGKTSYYWTTSSGGTITGGLGTNLIEVLWNISGSETVGVNYIDANGCKAANITQLVVNVNDFPSPVISGPNQDCLNTTSLYQTEINKLNYVWTISPGGTINGSSTNSEVNVTWDLPGSGGSRWLSVSYVDPGGCCAQAPTIYWVDVSSIPVPAITGPADVCFQSTGNIYMTDVGMSNYIWSVENGTITGGGTINDNTVTISWDKVPGGNHSVSVSYTNSFGCLPLNSTVYNVNVPPLPVPTIAGPDIVCVNSTGKIYTTESGMNSYIWTISSGGTITSGGGTNTIIVDWGSEGSEMVSVYYTNNISCTPVAPTILPVTVSTIPVASISGPQSACVFSTGNEYSTDIGMSNYIWLVSAGGVITEGNGTDKIKVSWNNEGDQNLSVSYTNLGGCLSQSTNFDVTIHPNPQPIVNGPVNCCFNSSGNIYRTQAGNTNYIWSVSSGGTITSGAGNNNISVTWHTIGNQTVEVMYTDANACTGNSPILGVTVLSTPIPSITGPVDACTSGIFNYSTETGMSNYLWTTSAGGTITGGAGSSQVEVSWQGTGTRWIAVNYTDINGCSATIPSQLNVTVYSMPAPGTAGSIAGSTRVCIGDTNISFWVVPIPNAIYYDWQLPQGASIASGAGTSNITVNFSNNAISGDILVAGVNPCGVGAPSPKYLVRVSRPLVNAGPVSGDISVCKSPNEVNYFISPIYDADDYIWTIPNGATIISGINTPSIKVDFSASSSGIISVFASNACGAGVRSPDLFVTVVPLPPTPVISLTGTILDSDQSSGNQWFLDGNPIPGAINRYYNVLEDGEYWNIINWFGCTSNESNHIYVTMTGINEIKKQDFSIYPVPNDGRFKISLGFPEGDIFYIRIYNDLGLAVYARRKIRMNYMTELDIDLKPIPMGVYTVVIENNNKRIVRKIVIIN